MKKKYFQPITTEVKAELQQMIAKSDEGIDTSGDTPGTGAGGPPSGPGGMSAKESGSLWDDGSFGRDAFADDEE